MPLGTATGGSATASIVNTSSSGRLNLTKSSQRRPMLSSQCKLPSVGSTLYLTTRPVVGAGTPAALVWGGGSPAVRVTIRSVIVVVRFPDRNAAAYTVR